MLPYASRYVKIAKGHALRLGLSVACLPAYTMNYGTGAVVSSQQLREAEIITITVNSGGVTLSCILPTVVSAHQ